MILSVYNPNLTLTVDNERDRERLMSYERQRQSIDGEIAHGVRPLSKLQNFRR